MALHHESLVSLQSLLRSKKCSSVEITQHFLKRIEQQNDAVNAFITPTPEQALVQARAADQRRAEGDDSPLLGLPIAHKDIFCTEQVRTTCGSRMLKDFISPYSSTVTERLDHAGMVSLGKTNLDEFAMGSSTETSYFGPSRNPWNHDYVPGGSSGGSAAAVAARLAPIATGTDTGGSIRQPAAFCGLTGLKPTYGRVSRWGMIAFASSLDQGGLLGYSAEDVALALSSLCGFDPRDGTSAREPVPDFFTATQCPFRTPLTIGLPTAFFTDELNETVRTLIEDAKTVLSKWNVRFVPVELPHLSLSIPTYYLIAPAEASSNLSRFDGVRFGYRCDNPQNLHDLYQRTRQEGFGREVKRRLLIGTYALSAGYYDAYYRKAQQVRQLIKRDFVTAFENVDIILAPSTPSNAFRIGEKRDDPVDMYLSDIYTVAVNLAGLPAMSLPMGFHNGLPHGLQLIGNYFDESSLLHLAHQYQSLTDWHKQIPRDCD
ncbi:MAG: Asp-tRNA(Asn)/Glu-tRNA(Gln) amidotransferase subunit GatA [Gammaproteobacteria bacterium]